MFEITHLCCRMLFSWWSSHFFPCDFWYQRKLCNLPIAPNTTEKSEFPFVDPHIKQQNFTTIACPSCLSLLFRFDYEKRQRIVQIECGAAKKKGISRWSLVSTTNNNRHTPSWTVNESRGRQTTFPIWKSEMKNWKTKYKRKISIFYNFNLSCYQFTSINDFLLLQSSTRGSD